MFANIPVTCNWQLQQAEGQTESDQESSAVTYAPAPGARQPCEINVQLWQLEEQGGATSIRIKSSARTYELYAKAHSTASPSYVASFRGKETEEAGIFFVKIPLQESCSRASEAILRLLSIRDKTRLEVHQVALDVPGIRGGVLEAPDDAEHSIPEPITWNEGLSALSPKAQSQAAQIRGMLQSALQPGPPTNGNGVRPGFARGNPPAQLMQAIAKAALESQVMPSLPPVAARSMPSGTLVHPQATHLSLEPTIPRNGTASAQLPSFPSSAGSIAGLAAPAPDVVPLLQSISSRLQRTDDRIAKMETMLDARLQEAVRSAPAAPSETASLADAGPASAEAAKQTGEGRATDAMGADDKALTPFSNQSDNVGMMISPFANGPGAQSRHQRRLSDPGGITRQNVYPGPESSRDSNQQSGTGAKQPDFTSQFDQLRSNLTADFANTQAELMAKMQAELMTQMQAKLMEHMQSMLGDSLKAAQQEPRPIQQASDAWQQEVRSAMDQAVSEIKADSSARQQEISSVCTELRTSLEEAQADGEKEAEEISGSLAELRATIEAAQMDLKAQQEDVRKSCLSLQASLKEVKADISTQQVKMTSTCADLRRCLEQGQSNMDMQHDVVRKACVGIQTSSNDSHATMRTQQEDLVAAASGIRASVKETQAEVKEIAAAVHSLGAKVSGLGKSAEQGSAVASTMAGLRKEFEGRLRELEDACKDNGTLLRQALSRPAAAPAPRSLQELSDQARGKTQETRSPVGSPQDSHHSRSSSMDSQGSMGESEHSWQTATADLASQASMHSVSSHGSARGTPRVQPPPPKPIRGRWSLPNV
ncbi:hypothetical protein WJX74_006599 [Apatococcus lobatus]|uniref:Uncharacterized protein n=1 Tax=Apatococcus lobatus TaxID=904363 RepID=A0AAW1RSG3_9CHLO